MNASTAVALVVLVLLQGCGRSASHERCKAKGGVFISVYKSHDICLKREAVIEYKEYE